MSTSPENPAQTIIVGVDQDQAQVVVAETAKLAALLGARVVCVNVQSGRFITQRLPESLGDSGPAGGFDDGNEPDNVFPPALEAHLESVFTSAGVSWEALELEGDPAKTLSRVAEEYNALMIVVGTRRKGMRSRMEQFIDGSIAVNLTHKQARPVLVVPQVVSESGRLPWEE